MQQTSSGRPEVLIKAPQSSIVAALVNKAIDNGYTIVAQTDYSLQFRRPLAQQEVMAASFIVGNAYSNNSRWLNYSFTKSGKAVRVVASSELQAEMVGGQINRKSLDANNALFNAHQRLLNDLKIQLE